MMMIDEIKDIFDRGRRVVFETGYYDEFSRALIPVLERHGNDAVEAIRAIIDDADPEVVGEALKWMGDLEFEANGDVGDSYDSRYELLIHCLNSPYVYIRDCAGLGLADLGDIKAIPALRETIKRESSEWMRKCFQQVIDGLNGL